MHTDKKSDFERLEQQLSQLQAHTRQLQKEKDRNTDTIYFLQQKLIQKEEENIQMRG